MTVREIFGLAYTKHLSFVNVSYLSHWKQSLHWDYKNDQIWIRLCKVRFQPTGTHCSLCWMSLSELYQKFLRARVLMVVQLKIQDTTVIVRNIFWYGQIFEYPLYILIPLSAFFPLVEIFEGKHSSKTFRYVLNASIRSGLSRINSFVWDSRSKKLRLFKF